MTHKKPAAPQRAAGFFLELAKYRMSMSAEMIAHIERTRREASHPPYEPDPAMDSAIELVEFLTKTFGNGMVGHAVSIGMAMPSEHKPIPMLSSSSSIIAPPKRGRGRPRKDAK